MCSSLPDVMEVGRKPISFCLYFRYCHQRDLGCFVFLLTWPALSPLCSIKNPGWIASHVFILLHRKYQQLPISFSDSSRSEISVPVACLFWNTQNFFFFNLRGGSCESKAKHDRTGDFVLTCLCHITVSVRFSQVIKLTSWMSESHFSEVAFSKLVNTNVKPRLSKD